MCWYYINIILILTLGILTRANAEESAKFNGFNVPCIDTSPECLKQSLQAIIPDFVRGIPELDIKSLDPFNVDSLVLSLPGDVKIEFKEAYTRGFRKCLVEHVRQISDDKFNVQFQCNLFSKGKYRSTGRLFMFPIDGEGQSTIITKNLKIRCSFQLSPTIKDDGEKYMQIKNFKTTHTFGGRVTYNMTNLFKGNSDMSKLVLDFMNQNWRMVADEFGTPIIDYGMNAILNNVKKLLNAVPTNNLILT